MAARQSDSGAHQAVGEAGGIEEVESVLEAGESRVICAEASIAPRRLNANSTPEVSRFLCGEAVGSFSFEVGFVPFLLQRIFGGSGGRSPPAPPRFACYATCRVNRSGYSSAN